VPVIARTLAEHVQPEELITQVLKRQITLLAPRAWAKPPEVDDLPIWDR
jgi:hypothetical protein